jgi:hypothetical protein
MLTEYKIKLEKDGLTITQRIESINSRPTFLGGNSLPPSYQQSQNANTAGTRVGCSGVEPPHGGGGFEAIPGGGGFDSIPGEGGFKAIPDGGTLGPVPDGEGFSASGTAPITVIGPNIFMCCTCSKPHEKKD